jgi:hypothetical protein
VGKLALSIEGLLQRLVGADELFHPSTHQTVRV